MSNCNKGSKGPIPPRWLHCPRRSQIIDRFFAFKTPLSRDFDSQIPEVNRFTVDMILSSVAADGYKIGLWIDLTNTSRFYNKNDIEKQGIRYEKLPCRGHSETPSPEQTKRFVSMCMNFIHHNPNKIIAVHCTHGFNRTGFMIASYLTEAHDESIDSSLMKFREARPPGIYKDYYIQELYKIYDDLESAPAPPATPQWCLDYDDSNIQDCDEVPNEENESCGPPTKKRRKESMLKNPVFMSGVPGVTPVLEHAVCSTIQKRVQAICNWEGTGFPGSQPVSMDRKNITLLHSKAYRVSWKADGSRYMMLIQDNGNVYFIDRNNSIFQVENITFLHYEEQDRKIKETLLDGEMVIDKVGSQKIPRYLAYDVIKYDGVNVSQIPFYPDRYSIIEEKLIAGRHKAMKSRIIKKEQEPFSIRLKNFWDVTQTRNLLAEKFSKQLCHEPDGLIFQPSEDPYIAGQSLHVLKWKPLSLNSVDFKLVITTQRGEGLLPTKIGQLFVGGRNIPFSYIKVTKQLKELDNKIIECKLENNRWVFMRERRDKQFPNSTDTAEAVLASIQEPVTTKDLLEYIHNHRFNPND